MRSRVVAFLMLGGCTLLNDPTKHVPEPLGSNEVCAALAEVLCDGITECCAALADLPRDECTGAYSASCASEYAGLLGDPRTGFDAEEAGYQLNVARTLVADCDPAIAEWLSRPDGFIAMMRGTVTGGASCDPTFRENFGTGMIDAARFFACEGELACRATVSGEDWRCLNRVGAGDTCTIADCELGLFCAGGSSGPTTCQRRLADGQPCTAGSQCDSYHCGGCLEPGTDRERCFCQPDDVPETFYCGALSGR